jgi:hypothetical protein
VCSNLAAMRRLCETCPARGALCGRKPVRGGAAACPLPTRHLARTQVVVVLAFLCVQGQLSFKLPPPPPCSAIASHVAVVASGQCPPRLRTVSSAPHDTDADNRQPKANGLQVKAGLLLGAL